MEPNVLDSFEIFNSEESIQEISRLTSSDMRDKLIGHENDQAHAIFPLCNANCHAKTANHERAIATAQYEMVAG